LVRPKGGKEDFQLLWDGQANKDGKAGGHAEA